MINTHDKPLWWQKGIIYEIYLRSFKDSNGDGIGDLKGIISGLDYLKWLGIDAIWVTPFNPSPMKDFGYDISDYRGVDPLFGSMQDFELLLAETHKRGLKLIIDIVPNHTSDQHPWFLESASSRNNPKRDWYLWHDPAADGGPPNNWLSVLGGSGWEWHEQTQQYYHHAFLKEQPDLNWRNPELQQAIMDMMRFWLDKGVDGFRVDVMWHLIKDKHWRNNPPNPNFKEGMPTYDRLLPLYSTDHPEVHKVVAMLRKVVDEYKEKVLIGEMYLPVENVVDYYGQDGSGAHLPGNFQLLLLDWKARKIALEIDKYESSLPEEAWPNWVLSNHDRPRLSTRIGKDQLPVAAMLLLTLRGTPTLYYGDEIGMSNVEIPQEEVQDPQGKLMPELGLSRDPQRTPMPWNKEDNAGFTSGKPWLRIAQDYKQVNVEVLKENKESILHFYKKLITLRRKEPALHQGSYAPVSAEGDILAYIRQSEAVQFLIVLNVGGQTADFIPAGIQMKGKVIISTHQEREGMKLTGNPIKLKPNEGVIIKLS